MSNTILVRATQARKFSHPNSEDVSELNKLSLLVRCSDMPDNIPFGSNPREANKRSLNKKIYKDVKDSLLGEGLENPGFFDLMNRGIVAIVQKAEFVSKDADGVTTFRLHFSGDYGLVDGGHTYRIITSINADDELRAIAAKSNQHVELRVIEIPHIAEASSLIPVIAKGLNTSVQVDDMSIANLGKKFANLKNALDARFSDAISNWPAKAEYESLIGWKQTDVSYMDAKEILSILLALDVDRYPLSGDAQPVISYSSPGTALKSIILNENVDKFVEIAADGLELFNTIQAEFKDKYNNLKNGQGKGGLLSIVEGKKRGTYPFPFSNHPDDSHRLMKGACLPIFSAFRVYMKYDRDSGRLNWNVPFEKVIEGWEVYSDTLINRTIEAAGSQKRNVANSIGKDSAHWRGLVEGVLIKQRLSQSS